MQLYLGLVLMGSLSMSRIPWKPLVYENEGTESLSSLESVLCVCVHGVSVFVYVCEWCVSVCDIPHLIVLQ